MCPVEGQCADRHRSPRLAAHRRWVEDDRLAQAVGRDREPVALEAPAPDVRIAAAEAMVAVGDGTVVDASSASISTQASLDAAAQKTFADALKRRR